MVVTLDVTIQEADGTSTKLQSLLRFTGNYCVQGSTTSTVAGHLNSKSVDYDPTLFRYLPPWFNPHCYRLCWCSGGQVQIIMLLASRFGIKYSLGLFSADVTQARVHLNTPSAVNSGQSYQMITVNISRYQQ